MMTIKKLIATATCTTAIMTGMAAAPAYAEDTKDIRHYQVAFTLGQGLRLRTGPSTNAPGYGADGNYTLPEGTWFSGECEAVGDRVTNPYGESTNIWMRTPGGYYVSEAYLNTGTNSSVGLPLCAELDFEAAQAATGTTVPALTVADYHREGWDNVGILNSDRTSGRFYFSKTASRKGAAALNKANGDYSLAGNLLCATAGAAFGLVVPGGVVAETIMGFGADMMCGAFAGSLTPENFEQALGAANAAASAGKCFEVRAHRESADQDWIYDVYTVTDSADYCG